MIKLSENKPALCNLGDTISALDSLDYLITKYSEAKAGPAYCQFEYMAADHAKVQIARTIIVKALKEQRQMLVDYMNTLNIEVDY